MKILFAFVSLLLASAISCADQHEPKDYNTSPLIIEDAAKVSFRWEDSCGTGGGNLSQIYVDGACLGALHQGETIEILVSPGPHLLTVMTRTPLQEFPPSSVRVELDGDEDEIVYEIVTGDVGCRIHRIDLTLEIFGYCGTKSKC